MYTKRPEVVFDVNNRQHRSYVSDFLTKHTWGECPVRFRVLGYASANTVGVIQRQLLEYYSNQEFKGVLADEQNGQVFPGATGEVAATA